MDGYTLREVVTDDQAGSLADELERHYAEITDKASDGEAGIIRESHRAKIDALIRHETEGSELSVRDRHYARGSYPELVAVLNHMRAVEYRRYRDFMRFCVAGLEIQSRRVQQRVDRLIILVALRMPKPIRVPADARRDEQDQVRQRMIGETSKGEKHANIRRLYHEEGWKQARIARHYNLSQQAVSKIVGEDEAA